MINFISAKNNFAISSQIVVLRFFLHVINNFYLKTYLLSTKIFLLSNLLWLFSKSMKSKGIITQSCLLQLLTIIFPFKYDKMSYDSSHLNYLQISNVCWNCYPFFSFVSCIKIYQAFFNIVICYQKFWLRANTLPKW